MTVRPTIFAISTVWDGEAGVWAGSCDALPASADAETLDGLLAKIEAMASDIMADNHPSLDRASVHFQIVALREMNPWQGVA